MRARYKHGDLQRREHKAGGMDVSEAQRPEGDNRRFKLLVAELGLRRKALKGMNPETAEACRCRADVAFAQREHGLCERPVWNGVSGFKSAK